MIGEAQPIDLAVVAQDGEVQSDQAVSIGLVVTELVINAIKYAFPTAHSQAQVRVIFEIEGAAWRLRVADNGVGQTAGAPPPTKGGLGTFLVQALVRQLDATMTIVGSPGMDVSIQHGEF